MIEGKIAELPRCTFDAIIEAIKMGDLAKAKALCLVRSTEHVPVHDGYMNWVAAMLTFIYQNYGYEKVNSALTFTQSSMWEPLFDQFEAMSLETKVRNICSLWHWHCTTFKVSEYDDKFTFHLDPCGSGMRLEKAGAYDGCTGYARVKERHPMTFMEEDFPIYSAHCAVNNQVQLARGLPLFIVEGWTSERKNGFCVQHTYKNLDAVPDEQFRRIGLKRNTARAPILEHTAKKIFSDTELAELSTPPMERAIAALSLRDTDATLALCEEHREGWPGLHDQYRDWISLLLIFIREGFGDDTYHQVLDETVHRMLAPIYLELLSEQDIERAAEQLARIWRGFGEPFTISENKDEITVTVQLNRIFSPRFAEKLGGVLEDFVNVHNRIIERWYREKNWSSCLWEPQLSLTKVFQDHSAEQLFNQSLSKSAPRISGHCS
jgi:predicted ArsR family transcriptional regulator